MAEKLYPPIIPGTLPAFYTDGTVTKITVPFSMNRAVSSGSIKGFALKLKTAYSNTLIDVLKIYGFNSTSKEITFIWETNGNSGTLSKIKPGQFLKAQLAYINTDNNTETIGYYSTVGVIKYTKKPIISINGFTNQNNTINIFQPNCYGTYQNEDMGEIPYSYIFSLFNAENQLVETSDWQLCNNSTLEDNFVGSYLFKTDIDTMTEYFISYTVKTINNLEETITYSCALPEIQKEDNYLELKAKNIIEDGYIKLMLDIDNENEDEIEYPFVIDLYRKEERDSSHMLLLKQLFKNKEEILSWEFKDFLIEQGIFYNYYFKYNDNGYQSEPFGNIEIMGDFEDMFLYDGQKQIKLRFNPKVSSFKINHLEQKTDVIGNRYPIFFRNSIVEYREFPISGLISYHLDDNELFIQDSLQELGIQIKDSFERQNNPAGNFNYPTKSLNLISNNIKAERLFKMKLLNWLGNGEIKLFKSPSEGNYLVRLMNISLSPEDKISRMLHTFSCTAYEVIELNYNNLLNLNFIQIDNVGVNSGKIQEIIFNKISPNNDKEIILQKQETDKITTIKLSSLIFCYKDLIAYYIKGNKTYINKNNKTYFKQDEIGDNFNENNWNNINITNNYQILPLQHYNKGGVDDPRFRISSSYVPPNGDNFFIKNTDISILDQYNNVTEKIIYELQYNQEGRRDNYCSISLYKENNIEEKIYFYPFNKNNKIKNKDKQYEKIRLSYGIYLKDYLQQIVTYNN